MDLQTVLEKGQRYFESGQIDEAETHFNYVLTCQPDNCAALNNLGVVAYRRGESKTAEKYFCDALAVDGENADALLNLADYYLKENRLHEAVRYLERCGRSHPTESLFKLLAVIHRKIDNPGLPDQFHKNVQPGSQEMGAGEPMISILIPSYNREAFIEECVMSAVDQSYPNYEILVIDDGSTDNTVSILEKIKSEKFRYLIKEHSGAPDTRNIGVREAKGDYVLWIGSDDCLMPGTLKIYQAFLKRYPDVDVFYGNLMVTDKNLNDQRPFKYEDWYDRNADMLAQFTLGNCIPDGGTLIRKSCYDRAGFYDEEFPRAHDYEWWTRLVGFARFKHVSDFVYKWRWHNSNMSTGSVKIDTSYEARILHKLLERHSLRELIPYFDWNSTAPSLAEALAHFQIAIQFARLKDMAGSLKYGYKSLINLPPGPIKEKLSELSLYASKILLEQGEHEELALKVLSHLNCQKAKLGGVDAKIARQ